MAITRAFKNGVNYDDFNALKHPVFSEWQYGHMSKVNFCYRYY